MTLQVEPSVAAGFRGFCGFTIYLFVCLSVCLSIDLSIYLSMYLSLDLSIYLSIYPSLSLSVCVFVGRSVRRSVCLFCLSVCLSVSLTIYLSISFFLSFFVSSTHELFTFGSGVLLGGALRAPPNPHRATKSALHFRPPRLPRNQYFTVNSPAPKFFNMPPRLVLFLFAVYLLSIYLSIHKVLPRNLSRCLSVGRSVRRSVCSVCLSLCLSHDLSIDLVLSFFLSLSRSIYRSRSFFLSFFLSLYQARASCSPLDLVCCWGGRCAPPQPSPRHEICTSFPTPAPATKSIFYGELPGAKIL